MTSVQTCALLPALRRRNQFGWPNRDAFPGRASRISCAAGVELIRHRIIPLVAIVHIYGRIIHWRVSLHHHTLILKLERFVVVLLLVSAKGKHVFMPCNRQATRVMEFVRHDLHRIENTWGLESRLAERMSWATRRDRAENLVATGIEDELLL